LFIVSTLESASGYDIFALSW